jgi:hypothetical protein
VEEFLIKWGGAIGIFVVTGTLMKAMNATIRAKAGDSGFKGIWFVWKRLFLLPIGAALGSLGPMLELSTPFGDGMGYSILEGVLAAFVAGQAYDMIVGSAKAKLKHKLARETQVPPAP